MNIEQYKNNRFSKRKGNGYPINNRVSHHTQGVFIVVRPISNNLSINIIIGGKRLELQQKIQNKERYWNQIGQDGKQNCSLRP